MLNDRYKISFESSASKDNKSRPKVSGSKYNKELYDNSDLTIQKHQRKA